MQYIIIAFFLLASLAVKSYFDTKTAKKKLMQKLHREWGEIPNIDYTQEKMESLQKYYNANQGKFDVDDITWNDIDMDTIFMLMNNTSCAIGEEYLYALLHKLEFDSKKLEKREELIDFFEHNTEKRMLLQTAFRIMGKLQNVSLYEYINSTEDIPKHNPLKHYCMALSLPASIIFIILSNFFPIPGYLGVVALIIFLFNNIIQYYQRKAEIEKYFNVFTYILRLLESIKEISKLNIPELESYFEELKDSGKKFKKFKRGSSLLLTNTKTGEGGMMDVFLDYIRMFFHVDLIKFDNMLSELRKNKSTLNDIFESIGTLDSMVAVASFRTWLNGEYCKPVLEHAKTPFLNIEDAYHPMIEEPVLNSMKTHKCILITGSNASGKSTFIKTIAINAILAQTIHTCMSRSYKASYFKIYSSMALRDNLQGKDSYYIVEIKSLKRILEQLSEDFPVLCFIDEVLRGTNTLERIAASAQILSSLSKKNAVCFAATHDLELTHMLEEQYTNYHFQEQVVDDDVLFDYVLYEGKAVSRNAIKLLKLIGYDKEIIEKAEQTANHFLQLGTWETL